MVNYYQSQQQRHQKESKTFIFAADTSYEATSLVQIWFYNQVGEFKIRDEKYWSWYHNTTNNATSRMHMVLVVFTTQTNTDKEGLAGVEFLELS